MKNWLKQPKLILAAIAFVVITVSAISTSCDIYRIIPLYVSLYVMLLQTRANKLCFLIGGLNAAFYAIVYFFLQLYGMALYSLLVACPIQLITYIRWRRHPYEHSTILRRLTVKQRFLWTGGFLLCWGILYFILSAFGSGYLLLDNTLAVLNTTANIASLLSLIEFQFIQTVSYSLNIILYSQMVQTQPMQWTYLFYSVYATICCILSARYMYRLYSKQQQEQAAS